MDNVVVAEYKNVNFMNMNQKIILKIKGMDCASCAVNIERDLKQTKGVTDASVNFASEKALVEYEPSAVSPADIKNVIKKSGYDAKDDAPTGNAPMDNELHDKHQSGRDEHRHDENAGALKKRTVASLIVSLPVAYLTMGVALGLPAPAALTRHSTLIQFILATAVIIINYHIWHMGWLALWRRRPNMDSLIFIGTLAAYLFSVYGGAAQIARGRESELYFEGVALILFFIVLGKYLEAVTKGKTSEAVKRLAGLRAKEAILLKKKGGAADDGVFRPTDYEEQKIPLEALRAGDLFLVKPGEKIATDGAVIFGESSVDESAISGESIPVEKIVGNKVIGATINKNGALIIRAEKIGANTMLAQIMKVVEEAMGSKAPIQLLADKISYYFVPAVIIIAAATFAVWTLADKPFTFALSAAVAVLIIACPCALGLATPVAVMMGAGLAAKQGILIKNAKALQTARDIGIVAFDKTGTLTIGQPKVTDIVPLSGWSADEILRLSASLEKNSSHPLAEAFARAAKEKNLQLIEARDWQNYSGQGIGGFLKINGEDTRVFLGNTRLMSANGVTVEKETEDKMRQLQESGKTVILVAADRVLGITAAADVIKKEAREALELLRKINKQTVIITGDHPLVGQATARELNIDTALSEVLPADKAEEIKKLQNTGKKVAFVGDGINDAPALAQADLGIAMSSGTDAAMETGDIILIKNDLRDAVRAIFISAYSFSKIKQNLFWALIYNIVGIPVAAGALYPITGWLLNPAIAAAAMAFSSVSVVLNALSMKFKKF